MVGANGRAYVVSCAYLNAAGVGGQVRQRGLNQCSVALEPYRAKCVDSPFKCLCNIVLSRLGYVQLVVWLALPWAAYQAAFCCAP